MNSLKNVLEGLLSSDFDVTEDDVRPIKPFIQKYRAKFKRYGYRHLKAGWTVEELGAILRGYGEYAGTVQSIDPGKFLSDVRSKEQLFVLIVPHDRPEFYVFKSNSPKTWLRYTCNPDYYRASLFEGIKYYNDELEDDILFKLRIPVQAYKLRDDQFLRDLQKYLS